jgi:D-alanyl-lipoteichoic acid acyltransferase DltB (MBOAT superfamily)
MPISEALFNSEPRVNESQANRSSLGPFVQWGSVAVYLGISLYTVSKVYLIVEIRDAFILSEIPAVSKHT